MTMISNLTNTLLMDFFERMTLTGDVSNYVDTHAWDFRMSSAPQVSEVIPPEGRRGRDSDLRSPIHLARALLTRLVVPQTGGLGVRQAGITATLQGMGMVGVVASSALHTGIIGPINQERQCSITAEVILKRIRSISSPTVATSVQTKGYTSPYNDYDGRRFDGVVFRVSKKPLSRGLPTRGYADGFIIRTEEPPMIGGDLQPADPNSLDQLLLFDENGICSADADWSMDYWDPYGLDEGLRDPRATDVLPLRVATTPI
uniref:Uncharacterized protein n=1 Tax=Timema shepardi TaxID=629360 RepID=A0A7R9G1E3_TIMSH|nr:unnamed protein product [Timema shepardi]